MIPPGSLLIVKPGVWNIPVITLPNILPKKGLPSGFVPMLVLGIKGNDLIVLTDRGVGLLWMNVISEYYSVVFLNDESDDE